MSAQRLKAIRKLIESHEIRSQIELQTLLQNEGFTVTQATLSRDVAKLNLRKERNSEGVLCYSLPQLNRIGRVNAESGDAVTITFSNHLAVLRTKTGYANGIAGDIDAHHLSEVIGTIAGDDTILIIPRQGVTNQQLIEALCELLPQLKENE